MPPIFNYKICDQAKDCSGIEVCPIHAIHWDEEGQKPIVDYSLCTDCGLCKDCCPVGAIIFCKTEKELEKAKEEIRKDPRSRNDLLIDRYGAMPIHAAFLMDEKDFDIAILESNGLACVELFNDSSINCLLYSIPFKELMKDIDIKLRKMKIENDGTLKKYSIKKLPCLIFFRDGKFIGKIEGYFDRTKIEEIRSLIKKIVG